MRTIYIQVLTSEKLGIVEEEGQIKEIVLDRPEQKALTGNIYKGKVTNVEKSLQAAFITYDGKKKGFLTKNELPQARKTPQKPIESFLTNGQDILVQVIKEPYQEKGAVLTANITFPGTHLVYLPFGGYMAASRKMDRTKSQELKTSLSVLAENEEGVIIRTSAAGIPVERIEKEFEQLRNSWQTLQEKSKKVSSPFLLLEDKLVPDRLLRKYAGKGIGAVICDEAEMAKKIRERIPGLHDVVKWKSKWEKELPEGLPQILEKVTNPSVFVPGGAEIVVEQTEAMVIIDVNSGSYLRKETKKATSLQVNLAAVPVIANQIRLRNLSGIIVIDFISMQGDKDRKRVKDLLAKELEKDPVRTEIYEFTALGLLEITRKRELPSVPSILREEKANTPPELSAWSKAYQLERELIFRLQHDSEAIILDIHPEVYEIFRHILPMSRLVEKKNQTVYSRITHDTASYHFRLEGTSQLAETYIQSKPAEAIDKLF